MRIRLKIILIVLPLIVTTLLLTGISSFFSATNAVTGIAKEFLSFKASELEKYADGQWSLLVENALSEKPAMVAAAQAAIEAYARGIIRSATEQILAFDGGGGIALKTGEIGILREEEQAVQALIQAGKSEMVTLRLGGEDRVAMGFLFAPFKWYFLVSEERHTFYNRVNQITERTAIILIAATAAAAVMILLFAGYMTRPLTRVVGTMRGIISTNDLSQRVEVEFQDEIGQLAHTFNIMVGGLEQAYNQIKSYAFKAVLAQKREHQIRNIFQKYVPVDVIDQFFTNPEGMLVGENRVLSILFSDIRSFTSISEKMMPDELVSSLNRYFSVMVDIIMNHKGVVDKYIGDAIMAFFGAPVKHEDDALQSVLAGIEMGEASLEFNKSQKSLGKPEFRIGIGINYGVVTVGNIGSEKKMDYTIIGDSVNLASRMEGLTKVYKQQLLISESVQMKVKDEFPFRLLDMVAVKGKSRGAKIYTTKKALSEAEQKAWNLHNSGMDLYYSREFKKAGGLFQEVHGLLGQADLASEMMLERCRELLENPPPEGWDGVEVMETK